MCLLHSPKMAPANKTSGGRAVEEQQREDSRMIDVLLCSVVCIEF